MILFITLVLMAIILIAVAVFLISIGGAAFAIIFGDIIVCVAIIIFIIKKIVKRKK